MENKKNQTINDASTCFLFIHLVVSVTVEKSSLIYRENINSL